MMHNKKAKPLIETERLLLREIELSDKEELFELHADPEVQMYTGEPVVTSMEEIEKAIRSRIKNYKKYGFGRLATLIKETDQFIGWAGLAYLPEFDEVDLGYRFKKEFWGKGYATEASKAIVAHGFNELDLHSIIAIAFPENKASIKVMEKVGMKYLKHAPYEEGAQDAMWYQIEKTTYNKR